MKKILLIAFTLCFISCATMRKPAVISATLLDYSAYPDFFITESNSVSFPYDPIASVYSSFESGYEIERTGKPLKKTEKREYDDVYGNKSQAIKTNAKYIEATPQETLNELVKKAKELGANGIINFDLNNIPYYDPKLETMVIGGFSASGMAIRK